MSDNKKRHKHKRFSGKSFIILPIVFLIGTYLVLYAALAPTIASAISVMGIFFSDTEKDYSTDYKNIFVPVSENSTIPTVSVGNEKRLDITKVTYPNYGDMFGNLIIEDCSIDCNLFFGDGDIALRNGVGIYNGSFIPGYGKTIIVAGHNNTYFNGLKNADKGQKVKIRTSYGNYEYEITETTVKRSDDSSAYDLKADTENLVMYTCYPFDELGLTNKIFFVYAKYVSGPRIDTRVLGD